MSDDHIGIITGAAERLLHHVTVGTHQRVRRKDKIDTASRPSEMEQQFQFALKGKAGAEVAWSEPVEVRFTYAYYFAPANRDSGLEYPQFTFGMHLTSSPPVGIHAVVTEWIHNETNGSIIGAKVSIGAIGANTPFEGFVHLTFQGYGALIEPDEETLINGG